MRVASAFLSVLALAGTGVAEVSRRAVLAEDARPSNDTTVEPKKFILELEQGADKDAIINQISIKSGKNKVLKVFDSSIFNAIAIECNSESTESLEALLPVVKAWRSTRIQLAPVVTGESFSDDAAALNYSIHWMTGVDKLHEQGILGKGVKVGIVDTGTEYTHPALGGCFGEGCKVAAGYDFVGDNNYWPRPGEERQPDDDPMDKAGHGTHVAGIVAGKSDEFTGVAPEATIYSYKVFGPNEGTAEEVLIEAFLRAFSDGVDIITASVGSVGGWSNNAWALVADRIVEQGVVVTIAAGNSGDVGPFFASSGSSGKEVLAIGSADASIVSARQFAGTFTGPDGVSNRTILGYRPAQENFPSDIVDWPIVPITLNISVENDACEPLPEGLVLNNTIPLVRFDEGCGDWERQRWVQERGAKFMLFYLTDRPVVGFSGRGWAQSRWGLLSKDTGEAIVKTIIAGGNVTADFSLDQNSHYVGMYNAGGGKPSVFTSWGGTFDLDLKPDVTAPGGRIFSSFVGHTYRDISGTSMACPYIAGVAALYISAHGGRSTHGAGFAKALRARIIASGRAVPWTDGSTKDFGFWAPPIQVGSGLVDAVTVLNSSLQLSGETKFALNDTEHFLPDHQVDITNTGATELEYVFEVQEAGGFESYWTAEAANQGLTAVPRIKDYSEIEPLRIATPVSLPAGTFKIGPGETKTAKFSFEIPNGLNSTRLPIWSGKILISANNGDVLSVPYYGVGGSVRNQIADMFYSSLGYPRIASGVNKTLISEKSSFTFNTSLASQDFVRLQVALTWGTRELRWDIYEPSYEESDWAYPPVVGEKKYVGSVASFDVYNTLNYPNFDPATDDPNDTFSYPLQDQPRDTPYESWWLGKLADGSQIKPGKYKMRIAALVPFGDPKASDDWQVTETPVIEVLPLSGGNSTASLRHRRRM